MLVLTDHSCHSKENSIYALLPALKNHNYCKYIDVASRGNSQNHSFFYHYANKEIFVSRIKDDFEFHPDGLSFTTNLNKKNLSDYQLILMRLPHPVSDEFLFFLKYSFPENAIINNPLGILETSSKAFVLNFPQYIPQSKMIKSIQEIESFKSQFPIVLKPMKGYGGNGIIKIADETVWEENSQISFSALKKA